MHIVVCVKQVPGTTKVAINPETNTLIRDGVEAIINPFDENALEAALVMKETTGAKVTVLCMGPPQAETVLREAMARGADDVVLLCDRAFAGSDTWATSYALAQGIRALEEKVDMVFCGKQAIDGDTAQVGPGIAEFMSWPVVTYVRKIEVEGETARMERVFEDGYERIEAKMPLVITTVKEMNIPRMASLKGRMRAKKAVIRMLDAAAAKADANEIGLKGSPTRVVKIFTPPPKTSGVKIDGSEPLLAARELVTKLKAQKLI